MIAAEQQKTVSLSSLLIANHSLVPPVCNPHVKESQQALEEFMAHYGLEFPQFYAVNAISAYIFPDADLNRLTLISELISLLYYIDDVYGDMPSAQGVPGEPISRDVLKTIEDCCMAFTMGQCPSGSSSLAYPFEYLHHEMRKYIDDMVFERLSTSLVNHLISSVKPSVYGWNPETASIRDYLVIREILSGMYPTINLIELAEGISLPHHIIHHPAVARMREACAKIGGLTNDLFSYEKEVIRRDLPMNFVRIIEHNEHCDFATAAQSAMDFINKETRIFFSFSEDVQHWDEETNALVERYVLGMKYQLSATWNWQMSTPRYRSPESPFEELRYEI